MIPPEHPLQDMLDRQGQLQRRYNAERPAQASGLPGTPGHTLALIDNAVMLADEAFEVLRETPWKKHKRGYGRGLTPDEVERVKAETIDCLHFVLNVLLLCGLDSEDAVWQAFMAKQQENHNRLTNGY